MPSLRAVRMTRQAISPRLAIRILVNMVLPRCPGRLALFKEPRQPLASFRGGADGGDPFGGVVDQARVDRTVGDREDKVFGGVLSFGAALGQSCQQGVDGGIKLISRHDLMDQANTQRL